MDNAVFEVFFKKLLTRKICSPVKEMTVENDELCHKMYKNSDKCNILKKGKWF